MKNVVIFEDGKFFRGIRAKLIKRGNKRVLIEFVKYDYEKDEDVITTEWFKVHSPTWHKSSINKRNNKRKFADYFHPETNEFYSDYYQTEDYKLRMKEDCGEEYWNELWGDNNE